MGADIHSVAEFQTEDGWQPVPDIFEYPYSSFHKPADRELLDSLPDHRIVDLFDFYYRSDRIETIKKAKSGELKAGDPTGEEPIFPGASPRTYRQEDIDHYKEQNEDPFEVGDALSGIIQRFADIVNEGVNRLREEHRKEGKGHDEWAPAIDKLRLDALSEATNGGGLTPGEREVLIQKALDHREESYEELLEREKGALERWPNDYLDATPEEVAQVQFESKGNRMSVYLHGDEGKPWLHGEPFYDRHYTLFFALGYEGRGAREVIDPIHEPRGIPEDAGKSARGLRLKWGPDGHGDNWATLAELKAYRDSDSVADYNGFVYEESFLDMKERGWPDDLFVVPKGSVYASVGRATYFTPEGYEKWVKLGRPYVKQPDKISFMADEIPITPEMLPDDLSPDMGVFDSAPIFRGPNDPDTDTVMQERTDKWKAQYNLTDEQIAELEEALANRDEEDTDYRLAGMEGRYTYHGVTPMIHIEYKMNRSQVLPKEFHDAIEKLDEFAAQNGLGDDQVRAVWLFDN